LKVVDRTCSVLCALIGYNLKWNQTVLSTFKNESTRTQSVGVLLCLLLSKTPLNIVENHSNICFTIKDPSALLIGQSHLFKSCVRLLHETITRTPVPIIGEILIQLYKHSSWARKKCIIGSIKDLNVFEFWKELIDADMDVEVLAEDRLDYLDWARTCLVSLTGGHISQHPVIFPKANCNLPLIIRLFNKIPNNQRAQTALR
jgi:hypothetical protein